MRSGMRSQFHRTKQLQTVDRGRRFLGIARHWQPVDSTYVCLPAPGLPSRTGAHSSSFRSLGSRSLARLLGGAVLDGPHRRLSLSVSAQHAITADSHPQPTIP